MMRTDVTRFLTHAVLFSTFLAGVVAAQAQTYERRDRALFDRARTDLDRASSYPYSSRDDRRRFDEARRELFDFESRFDQGRYEKHELNEAIDRIQRVVSHNSLDPRDRGALEDDLRRMRDYRAFRDHGGYAYGYRR
jgi:hypothetical protein